ncbi:MAG: DUF2911 domain-containing protein [Candidatus Cyclobacteriaceae bacterium M2_1C_046]
MLKKILIFLGIVFALLLMTFFALRSYTKSFSPQDVEALAEGDVEININYSRPFRDGREIFGELVPYNKIWRTGANEATIFKTNKDLVIKGQLLPAGEYSLWTIPGEDSWKILWNKETGQWGINTTGNANRKEENDIVIIDAPVIKTTKTFEQFTIDIDKVSDDINLVMIWENTMIVVPMEVK